MIGWLVTTEAEKGKESKSCHLLTYYSAILEIRKEIQTVSKSFIFVNQDKARPSDSQPYDSDSSRSRFFIIVALKIFP